jgi:predicted enzyme related to lactoylglutathione lyase
MSTHQGQHVWYELMTSDAKAAEAFYTRVVGWSAADSGMPGVSYTLLSVGATRIAGLMTLPPEASAMGAKPGWIGYVAVDDVDAKTAEVRQRGGSVYKEPADIPGIGRFAVVADPGGASLCLFKPASSEGPAPLPPATPGTVGWHELHAANLDAAWDFYSACFGWTKADTMDMGPMGVYQLFRSGGADACGGMMTKMAESPRPVWLYYINVEAIDAAVERVKAGGGQVINGPMEVPGGSWMINALDPQGAMFALLAPRR